MMPWIDLYRQHVDMRTTDGTSAQAIRSRLIELASRGHCRKTIQGRFTNKSNHGLREWYIRSEDGGPEGTEPLTNLPHLEVANLTVLALMKDKHLRCFTVMLAGQTKDGRDWTVAVHLEDDAGDDSARRGSGACSHAAFHCHVGPTLETEPKVRVPLPPVGPLAALDWVLSLVVPGWEPVPWPETSVQASSGAQV